MTQHTPPEPDPPNATWMPVPTLAQAVGDWLAEEILQLRIKPGRRLTETEVATALGVSRQPVREAMRILAEQGLLVLIPRVGAVVAQFDPGVIVEIYEVRGFVEAWLVVEALDRISDEEVRDLESDARALVDRYQSSFDPDFYDQAWEIRTRLYAFSGNGFAVQLASDLRSRLRTYPRVLRVDPDHIKVYQEHMFSLLAACRARDGNEASRLIVDYMRWNGARLSAILQADLEAAALDSD